MLFSLFLLAAGATIAGMVLRDVFDTVVVPGESRATLHVAHRLVAVFLPLWKAIHGRRRGLSSTFAPLILVSCFIVWMALLALGFGLMAYAVRADFKPPVDSVGEAVYLAGSSLVTVGLSQINPEGLARWVILAAGFCGLAVMTMAVTYLLEVQDSIARRDSGIIKLNTSAGDPPSAVTLLERYAAINNREALRDLLEEARTWCASVRQSHSSHPSLVYFQSVGTGLGWPAALGAALDLALLLELCVDDQRLYGPAVLLGADGTRMARELAMMISVEPKNVPMDVPDLEAAVERLSSAGYPVQAAIDFDAIAERRSSYRSCVDALAEHLGKPGALLIRR